jgi:threonine synthase
MEDKEAAALVAAGRLLQSKTWPYGRKKIEREAGESYPAAVARAIKGLPEDEREKLRELTQWVRDYERAERQQ